MKKALLLIGVCFCIAFLLQGCLDGDKTLIARYDNEKDAMCILTVWQNIRAEESNGEYDPQKDLAYLEKMYNNRDHLIFPPLGSPIFDSGFGDWAFLRLSGDQYTKLPLSKPSETERLKSTVDLDKITILPGQFFMREPGNLCYYHQAVIPGEQIDQYLEFASEGLCESLSNAIYNETQRRVLEGFTPSWDAYSKKLLATVEAGLKNAISDGPEPGNLDSRVPFSDETLKALHQAAVEKKIAFKRNGSVVALTLGMSDKGDDAAQALKTLNALQSTIKTLANALPPKDAESARNAKYFQKIAVVPAFSRDGDNLTVQFDLAEFINAFQSPTDPVKPLEKAQIDHAAELAKLAADRLPVDKTLTIKQVVDQFKEGKLPGNLTNPKVKAGEGLQIEP